MRDLDLFILLTSIAGRKWLLKGGRGSMHDEFFNPHEHSFLARCAKLLFGRGFLWGYFSLVRRSQICSGIKYANLPFI
jgi:hypothetical protein